MVGDWLSELTGQLHVSASVCFLLSSCALYVFLNHLSTHDLPDCKQIPVPKEAEPGWGLVDDAIEDDPIVPVHGSRNTLLCVCPATGKTLGVVQTLEPKDVDELIILSQKAQRKWAEEQLGGRVKVLKVLLKYILQNKLAISRVACRDSGKTGVDAILGEILVTVEKIRWTIRHGPAALRRDVRPNTNILMAHKRAYVEYEPLGVVAALVSWNYPCKLLSQFDPANCACQSTTLWVQSSLQSTLEMGS
jgi:acyl-CoA reductase-like NAD-dependent aldehyde dehydrogenase